MRKIYLSFVLILLIGLMSFGTFSQSNGWKLIGEENEPKVTFDLLETKEKENIIEFSLTAYKIQDVIKPGVKSQLISIPEGFYNQKKGYPDLPQITQSIIIPDIDEMKLEIISVDYEIIKNINIIPSKGVISRSINPSTIPYEYGTIYKKDRYYPESPVKLNDPYIIRDYRGIGIKVIPIQYNPVKNEVKICKKIKFRIYSTGKQGRNVFEKKRDKRYNPIFHRIYSNQFLNYNEQRSKYTPVSDKNGNMLVICYNSFLDEAQAYVDWKNSIGIQTEIVSYSSIGSSSSLKNYVQNYYDQNGLTFLMLIGDHQQIPSSYISAGYSDNNYGYVAGDDHYLDVFVGRFSAVSETEVTNQVNKTIYYERDFLYSSSFITQGVAIASNEGGGGEGDNGESDEQHMNYIINDLKSYGYTMTKCYQNGGSAAQLSTLVNAGSGVINYVGHGSITSWSAPYFNNDDVNDLTNVDSYPFIISVACVVGKFTGTTCFAESWLRATHIGEPSGAVVFCGSTINQSWASPMCAQDEMNDLLVSDTVLTFGGVFANGLFKMVDEYGFDGEAMADTWTVFGDVSVQLRTPSHPDPAIIDEENPATPENVTCTYKTGTEIHIGWDEAIDNMRVAEYDIYMDGEKIFTVYGSQTWYAITGLESYVEYDICIKASDPSGNESNFSDHLRVTTLDIIPPTVPANLEIIDRTVSSITLSWEAANDNVDVTKYDVFVGGELYDSVDSPNLTYEAVGLEDDTVYAFTIKAKDLAGNVSDTSNSVNGWPIIKIEEEEQGVIAYPNPSIDGSCVLEVSSIELGEMNIRVYNIRGGLVLQYNKEMIEEREKIRMHIDEPGIYEVHIVVGNNSMSKMIIVQ